MSAALLAQLVAPAIVVAWSPMKVIPALVLVFNAPRPRAAGLAFLIGSLIGQAAATVLFLRAPELVDRIDPRPTPTLGWIQIALAAAMFAAADYTWSRRHTVLRAPRWLIALTRITPLAAGALGAVLVFTNFKVMAANATAGYLIGSAAISLAATGVAVLLYTAVATSTIAIPVAGYLVAPAMVDRWLAAARSRLARHQARATTAALVLIGAAMVVSGIATLAA